jgi:hypothetical protein
VVQVSHSTMWPLPNKREHRLPGRQPVAYPLDIAPWAVCQACTISSRRMYSAVDPSAMVRPEIVRRASVSRNRMRPHPGVHLGTWRLIHATR